MFKRLNVIKEMVSVQRAACSVQRAACSVQRATIELWMHLRGLLSTHEARVTLTYQLGATLALLSCLAASHVHS